MKTYTKNIVFSSFIAFAVGFLVAIGWILDIPLLTSPFPGYNTMKFTSALLFMFTGIGLYCAVKEKWYIIKNLAACIILVFGLLFFFFPGVAASVELSNFIITETSITPKNASLLKKISMGSALSFTALGLGLLLINASSKALRQFAQYLFHLVTLIGCLAVFGYLLNVPIFYTFATIGSMALHTGLLFILVSISASFYNRQLGVTGLLTGNGVGHIMARRLFPMLFLLVILLGTAHIIIYRNGFITVEFGIALFAASFILLGLVLISITAFQLNKLNVKKNYAEDQLVDLSKTMENKVAEGTTELRRSMEALEYSKMELWKNEALLKTVINNISSAFFAKDTNGRYILINQKFADALLLEESEIIGKTAADLFSDDIARNVAANEMHIITSKTAETNELAFEADGVSRTLLTNKFPLLDEQGNVFAICGVASDYTDEKKNRLEQEILSTQLQRKNQQLLNFAHITSHNLRSPVSNLNSLLWLYKESQTSEEKALLFEKFEIVIHNLSQTLNELVDALKIQEDTGKQREPLDFEEVFKKVKESMIGKIMETGAVVSYNFTKAPSIEYPRLYLESILQNLLSNSLKYRSPYRTPVIHAETFVEQGSIVLHFKDNGLGIDMKRHSDKLFGLNKTFHRHEEAKGVGLFITKTQVEAMGGNVSANSEVNKGTTIIISFHKKA